MLLSNPFSRATLVAVFCAMAANCALATEVQLGFGWSGLDGDEDAAVAVVEVASMPLLTFGGFDLGVGLAASLDTDGDAWAGAGPILRISFAEYWRIEGSVMPGFYEQGSGADLGGSLQFRSKLAVSRRVADGYRVGVMLSHLSNAGLETLNPGEDAALLFLAFEF